MRTVKAILFAVIYFAAASHVVHAAAKVELTTESVVNKGIDPTLPPEKSGAQKQWWRQEATVRMAYSAQDLKTAAEKVSGIRWTYTIQTGDITNITCTTPLSGKKASCQKHGNVVQMEISGDNTDIPPGVIAKIEYTIVGLTLASGDVQVK